MALPDSPQTREEEYLAHAATGGGTIPEYPVTREEMYLNKIATGDGAVPDTPLTRKEMYLAKIAENGGGGGGSSGGGVEYVTFAKVDNAWNHDKSYSEISEAYNAGKVIVAVFKNVPSVMAAVVNGGQTGFVTTTITDPEHGAVGSDDMTGFTYWQIVILDGQTIVNSNYANWSNSGSAPG